MSSDDTDAQEEPETAVRLLLDYLAPTWTKQGSRHLPLCPTTSSEEGISSQANASNETDEPFDFEEGSNEV